MIRRFARPMLASVFVIDGVETLRNPAPRIATAAPLVDKAAPLVEKGEEAVNARVSADVPPLPKDTETWVKALAGVKIGAGVLFAIGKMPRLSAAALIASHVPTTVTRNAFWSESDPAAKSRKTTGLATDVALLGALMLASMDTEGRPGLAWRAGRAKAQVAAAMPGVKSESAQVAERAGEFAQTAADQARSVAETVREKAPEVADQVRTRAPEVAAGLAATATQVAGVVREKAPEVAATARDRASVVAEQVAPVVGQVRELAVENAGVAREKAGDARERIAPIAEPMAAAARDRAAATRARAAVEGRSAADSVRGTALFSRKRAADVRDRAADARDQIADVDQVALARDTMDRVRADVARTIAP